MKTKNFFIDEVFDSITIGKSFDKQYLSAGKYPFIGRSSSNNGFQCFVDIPQEYLTKGSCITIGMVGTFKAFWQENAFAASQNILVLRNKNINKFSALYLCTILNLIINEKYSYNRPLQKNKFIKEQIKLPEKRQKPDFKFMEDYIKDLYNEREKQINTKIDSKTILKESKTYKKYKLKDLFNFYKGKRLTKADMIPGRINFIGAVSENNGVRECIDTDKYFKPNCITINYNGSVGESFYQSEPFFASDDVNVLYAKNWNLNKYIAMYIITLIKANRYRFSYGRKWTLDKMKETIINLPSLENGLPDYCFMENYIKSLPFSDLI